MTRFTPLTLGAACLLAFCLALAAPAGAQQDKALRDALNDCKKLADPTQKDECVSNARNQAGRGKGGDAQEGGKAQGKNKGMTAGEDEDAKDQAKKAKKDQEQDEKKAKKEQEESDKKAKKDKKNKDKAAEDTTKNKKDKTDKGKKATSSN